MKMTWYAAHAIMYFKLKQGVQDRIPVWENVYLIEADSEKVAEDLATARAKECEGDSQGTLLLAGKPATLAFAGIRKIVAVSHESDAGQLQSGDEVTYSEFEVDSEAQVRQLISGDSVHIEYIE